MLESKGIAQGVACGCRRSLRRAGFTFMEIMLVVVIIGILAAVVVPNIFHHSKTARENATKMAIDNAKTALQTYYLAVGDFPTTEQGLDALVHCPSGVDPERWGKHSYMDRAPVDGWGHKLLYRCPGEHGQDYDLFSKGNDDQEGTEDDIVSWDTSGDKGNL